MGGVAIPMDVIFGALDTKTDPMLLPPGALTQAENATSQTPNSYTTRRGYSQLAAGPAATVAAIARGSELTVSDGQRLWSHDAIADKWIGLTHGQVAEAIVTKRSVVREQGFSAINLLRPTIAATNGVTAVAWMDATGGAGQTPVVVCYNATGQVIFGPAEIDTLGLTASNVRMCAAGNTLVLFAITLSGVSAYRCDTTVRPLVWSGGTVVEAAAAVTPILDASPIDATSIVAMWTIAGKVRTALVNPATLAVTATLDQVATLASDGGGGIVGTSGEKIYAAWFDSVAGLKLWVLTTALASSSGPTVIDSYTTTTINQVGLVRYDATNCVVAWNRDANGTAKRSDGVVRDRVRWCKASQAVSLSAITDLTNLSLISKPFSYNGGFYFHALFDSALAATQATNFLLRISPDGSLPAFARKQQTVAMDQYRTAARDGVRGTVPAPFSCCLQDWVQSGGAFTTAQLASVKYLSTDSPITAVDMTTFDLASAQRHQATPIGQLAIIPGGVVTNYDGVQVTEQQFLTFPEGQTATPAASGGSMADGTYQYVLIYEATDNFGNTHQSTTSLAISATIVGSGGAGKVTLSNIPEEPLITMHGPVPVQFTGVPAVDTTAVSIFRTAPSVSVGVFYHVATLNIVAGGISISYVDTASDATVSKNRQLYTTGGVLDKEPPLSCQVLVSHDNALWGISSEDPQLLFYSGDYLPGVAPWFSSGFQMRCDTGGAMTALAALDDKLIVFKADRIFFVAGSRPNATGSGGSLTTPQLVSSDVGCIEPRSIVRTGDGVYFLSAKGIYLLDRGLNVTYVGAPVEYFVIHYANCVGATLLPDRQEIRWEFTGPVAPLTAPRKLVYNYFSRKWTTHLNYNSLVPVAAIGNANIPYTWFTAAGAAYQELAASAQQVDPGTTFIPMTLETGWLAPAGPQGLARCQYAIVLGSHQSTHGLQLQIARNYTSVYSMSKTFSDATLSALPTDQVSYNLREQQGESFRVMLSTYPDGSSSGYGQSMKAVGVRLVAIPKRGSFNKFLSAAAKG